MILQGSLIKSTKHCREFSRHLFKAENEIIKVWETPLGGETFNDLASEMLDLQLYTKLTKGKTGIFHVAINPRQHENMSSDQWHQAVSAIQTEFGLLEQDRILVYHQKSGRSHLHCFFALTDLESRKLIQVGYYKRRLQRVAAELEHSLGHEQTYRKTSNQTICISNADRMRQSRTGMNAVKRKKHISRMWQESKTGQEFVQRLQSAGYSLAAGDKSKYVLLEPDGEPCNLVRQLPKVVRLKHVDDKLKELYMELPRVKQVRARKAKAKKGLMRQVHNQIRRVDKLRQQKEKIKKIERN